MIMYSLNRRWRNKNRLAIMDQWHHLLLYAMCAQLMYSYCTVVFLMDNPIKLRKSISYVHFLCVHSMRESISYVQYTSCVLPRRSTRKESTRVDVSLLVGASCTQYSTVCMYTVQYCTWASSTAVRLVNKPGSTPANIMRQEREQEHISTAITISAIGRNGIG